MADRTSGERGALTPELQVAIARLRDEVALLHAELVRRGAFAASGAVVSARVVGADLLLIAPELFPDALRGPETLVLCDLDGTPVRDTPGSDLDVAGDARLHARVYRARPDLGGVVRLRAPHVSAFALRAEAIPADLGVLVDAFGADIPVGPGLDGRDGDADALLAALAASGSRALVLPGDGLLTVGADAWSAVRAAVVAEEAAAAIHHARAAASPAHPAEAHA
jgi:L-ribulose-5-phosphate 4-epimerase